MRIVLLIVAGTLTVITFILARDNILLGAVISLAVWGLVGLITGKLIIKRSTRHLSVLENIAAGIAWGAGTGFVMRLVGAPSSENSQLIFFIVLGSILAVIGTGVNNLVAAPRT